MSLVDDKVKVRRANTVLTVNRDDVERYIKKGFDLLDSKGTVIKAAVPSDASTLQKAFVEHTNKIKELEAKIAELETAKKDTTKTTASKKKATKDA